MDVMRREESEIRARSAPRAWTGG